MLSETRVSKNPYPLGYNSIIYRVIQCYQYLGSDLMNAIVNVVESNTAILQLPQETESLIKASIAENTLKAYQLALQSLTVWLSGRVFSDALLANYITALHEAGKSAATIGQVVTAVKWQLKHQS